MECEVCRQDFPIPIALVAMRTIFVASGAGWGGPPEIIYGALAVCALLSWGGLVAVIAGMCAECLRR